MAERIIDIHDWIGMGLIPMDSSLEFWHISQRGESGNDILFDHSGNDRHISSTGTAPVFTDNLLNGYPGIYFNGTASPLRNTDDTVTLKHIFLIAAFEDAAFAGSEGLLSDTNALHVLKANGAASVKFANLSQLETYRKNDTVFIESNLSAPMSGNFALIEIVCQPGLEFEGFQIGRDLSGTKWKGWFIEDVAFSRVLTVAERRGVLLYFNLKFNLLSRGVPLWFPSKDITGLENEFFDDEPERFDAITDSYTYADDGKDLFETSDEAPLVWQVKPLVANAIEQTLLFDAFWRRARLVNTFFFRDKDSVTLPYKYSNDWSGVRIGEYSRRHRDKQNLSQDKAIQFTLVKDPHSDVDLPEEIDYDITPPSVPTGPLLEAVSSAHIYCLWTASTGGATGYEVLVDETTVFDAGNHVYYVVGGLGASSAHTIQVRAYDAAGNRSAWSAGSVATTLGVGGEGGEAVLLFDGHYLTFDGNALLF